MWKPYFSVIFENSLTTNGTKKDLIFRKLYWVLVLTTFLCPWKVKRKMIEKLWLYHSKTWIFGHFFKFLGHQVAKNDQIFLKINRVHWPMLINIYARNNYPTSKTLVSRAFTMYFLLIFASFLATRGPKMTRFFWKLIGFILPYYLICMPDMKRQRQKLWSVERSRGTFR